MFNFSVRALTIGAVLFCLSCASEISGDSGISDIPETIMSTTTASLSSEIIQTTTSTTTLTFSSDSSTDEGTSSSVPLGSSDSTQTNAAGSVPNSSSTTTVAVQPNSDEETPATIPDPAPTTTWEIITAEPGSPFTGDITTVEPESTN